MIRRGTRRWNILSFAVFASAGCAAIALAADGSPGAIRIGSGKQLFFDRKFIEEAENVRIVMNPPVKRGPVLHADKPWEDFRLTSYFTVIQDGQLCRMYYSCFSKDQWHTPNSWEEHAYLCYAVSTDGVHWTKPELGIVEFQGSNPSVFGSRCGAPSCTPFNLSQRSDEAVSFFPDEG